VVQIPAIAVACSGSTKPLALPTATTFLQPTPARTPPVMNFTMRVDATLGFFARYSRSASSSLTNEEL